MSIRKGITAAALVWLVAFMAHQAATGTADSTAGAPPAPAPQGGAQPPAGRGGGQRGGGRATFPAQQRSLADAEDHRARQDASTRSTAAPVTARDLRGGDIGGPNLLRSQLVLNDQHGELIVPVVKNGRQNPGMPPMPALPLAEEDVKAIAEYIHSVAFTMRGQGTPPPGEEVELNIVVGDAKAGEAYFAAKCASCHSATGRSARASATRIASPLQLQNTGSPAAAAAAAAAPAAGRCPGRSRSP